MPCSFCRNETHNISTCMPLATQRALSIYNDDIDYKPNHIDRHLEPNWWVTINNNNMLHISPASKNVKALLTSFSKLRGTHCIFPEEEIGYLMMENNFSRNPTGVIKFYINNNRMLLEEITDNWEHILNEYTNAIIDIHLIQLERIERIERERENNNRTPPPQSRILPLGLVHIERAEQREREREHRDEIQRRLYVSAQRRRGTEEDIQQMERATEVENERQEQRRQHQQRQRQEQQRQHQERIDAMISCDKAIETTECPICMEDLKSTNRMILRCGHQFCGDCIFTHFQKQYGCKCPSCRGEYALRVSGWQPPKDITISHPQSEMGDLETIRRILFATPAIIFDENTFASDHNEIDDEDDNIGF